jgi:hypothetical protein
LYDAQLNAQPYSNFNHSVFSLHCKPANKRFVGFGRGSSGIPSVYEFRCHVSKNYSKECTNVHLEEGLMDAFGDVGYLAPNFT